jgi:uridine kinase
MRGHEASNGLRRTRDGAIAELALAIESVGCGHPLRVAIDGVGASGKTSLADELAARLAGSGREIIRAGVDGFHNPPSIRHRRGADSPEGYYEDSFDHGAIWRCLVGPLGEGGDRVYRRAVYDFRSEQKVEEPPRVASENAILLFDGVFLLRPELKSWWDFSVFVDAGFDTTLRRALSRDIGLFGSREGVRRRYETRYIPGETIYLEFARPRRVADAVFENDDPKRPRLLWNG